MNIEEDANAVVDFILQADSPEAAWQAVQELKGAITPETTVERPDMPVPVGVPAQDNATSLEGVDAMDLIAIASQINSPEQVQELDRLILNTPGSYWTQYL